ncbi:hypothetical protein M409DRAFT_24169 [Zasmidium cellare ATCC 36951]|uniref:AMP-activated protein kinase glycogen-binding domain-containing protein n=1 Tax=Zasmidium cellare ATCC 36951 TaxID=1080233 RepID=A0A6A6CI00_ZASCE|nr:uncharacterized protein M409DRAFT_24169 [Zasmidium cellare ATCC 36951]KAF2165319.1 hypothetical protein M409DRAFT_24169 [Zasmidium cellare ATCC 36951]
MSLSPPKRVARAAQQALQPSIDSNIDSVPANAVSPAATRPHTSKHPSWVGPKPPGRKTPSIVPMKQPITITFSSPGLRPPVYIGTDLTDPQWDPVEMDGEQTDKGEYTFCKSFMAEEGEYQYKLRLGPGDWWICDDSKPKVDDGNGNENNLAVVVADPTPPPPPSKDEQHPSLDTVDSVTGSSASGSGPLFRHETLAPPAGAPRDKEDDEEVERPPLLRHESIAPSSHEQNHSPLFRHESMAIDDKLHNEPPPQFRNARKSSSDSIPQEADPNDPSLEVFPTDHKGIMEHLNRTRSSIQEDETSDDVASPSQSPANSAIASVSPSLPSVREDEDGELDHLREEAGRAVDAENEELLSPNSDVPTLRIVDVDMDRPAAPITPPETPKEDDDDKELVDSPMTSRMKVEQLKQVVREKVTRAQEKLQENTEQVKSSAIPGFFLVLSFAVALASAGVAWWYIKTGADNVVVDG